MMYRRAEFEPGRWFMAARAGDPAPPQSKLVAFDGSVGKRASHASRALKPSSDLGSSTGWLAGRLPANAATDEIQQGFGKNLIFLIDSPNRSQIRMAPSDRWLGSDPDRTLT